MYTASTLYITQYTKEDLAVASDYEELVERCHSWQKDCLRIASSRTTAKIPWHCQHQPVCVYIRVCTCECTWLCVLQSMIYISLVHTRPSKIDSFLITVHTPHAELRAWHIPIAATLALSCPTTKTKRPPSIVSCTSLVEISCWIVWNERLYRCVDRWSVDDDGH